MGIPVGFLFTVIRSVTWDRVFDWGKSIPIRCFLILPTISRWFSITPQLISQTPQVVHK